MNLELTLTNKHFKTNISNKELIALLVVQVQTTAALTKTKERKTKIFHNKYTLKAVSYLQIDQIHVKSWIWEKPKALFKIV